MNMEVTTSRGITILTPFGHLDASTAGTLEPELLTALEFCNASVIINMSEITYMSSEGLRLLVVVTKKAAEKKLNIIFAEPIPMVDEILKITMFSKIMRIVPTLDEAIDELS